MYNTCTLTLVKTHLFKWEDEIHTMYHVPVGLPEERRGGRTQLTLFIMCSIFLFFLTSIYRHKGRQRSTVSCARPFPCMTDAQLRQVDNGSLAGPTLFQSRPRETIQMALTHATVVFGNNRTK